MVEESSVEGHRERRAALVFRDRRLVVLTYQPSGSSPDLRVAIASSGRVRTVSVNVGRAP